MQQKGRLVVKLAVIHLQRGLDSAPISGVHIYLLIISVYICGAVLRSVRSLKLHMLHVHNGGPKVSCKSCKMVFRSEQKLRTHYSRVHLKKGRFTHANIVARHLTALKITKIMLISTQRKRGII